jgi:hypothetical protein
LSVAFSRENIRKMADRITMYFRADILVTHLFMVGPVGNALRRPLYIIDWIQEQGEAAGKIPPMRRLEKYGIQEPDSPKR